jgi:prolyl 4-hydroxylase
MKSMFISFVVIAIAIFSAIDARVDLSAEPPEYGVDCSYPIHYGINKRECPYFYDVYHKMMDRCASYYSREECEQNERDRMRMNLAQARNQHNYTAIGFKKLKAPKEAWEPLLDFYNRYKHEAVTEKWYRGATIVNTWDSPSKMVSFENTKFRGGVQVKEKIWEGVRPIIQEWIGGYELQPTSLYGIRLYTDGSVLATRKLLFIYLSSAGV